MTYSETVAGLCHSYSLPEGSLPERRKCLLNEGTVGHMVTSKLSLVGPTSFSSQRQGATTKANLLPYVLTTQFTISFTRGVSTNDAGISERQQ